MTLTQKHDGSQAVQRSSGSRCSLDLVLRTSAALAQGVALCSKTTPFLDQTEERLWLQYYLLIYFLLLMCVFDWKNNVCFWIYDGDDGDGDDGDDDDDDMPSCCWCFECCFSPFFQGHVLYEWKIWYHQWTVDSWGRYHKLYCFRMF